MRLTAKIWGSGVGRLPNINICQSETTRAQMRLRRIYHIASPFGTPGVTGVVKIKQQLKYYDEDPTDLYELLVMLEDSFG